ncbi:MAG: hypothetical protein UFG06_11575 [Lachnospiraceae bacterium]|nr:hypothetical protein [Lachnospiraceae bacterium]
MKTILKKGIKEIPSFLVLIYICFFVSLLFATIFTTAPREIRDAANVSLAQQFANMQNPYVVTNEHEYIESINVYPPLNMLIAAALHMLTTLNLYNIFYALDFLYIILTAALITRFIQKYYNASLFLCLLVFAASLTLGWRTGFISTIPDHLGMLIIVMLLISPKSSHRFSILTDSILTVLSFYSKQYFLAVCVTVFLYHLLHDYKAAFRYFIYTAILGILSITILNILFPALSIQLLFFMSAENSGINAGKILYSLKQIFLLLPLMESFLYLF